MGKKSGVSWTDASHGFWYGCKKVSAGCLHCYAEREMKKFGKEFRSVQRSKQFNSPLNWKEPLKIFVNPWSDFFIKEADPWRDEAWKIIKATPQHTYQILTKRIEDAEIRLPDDWGEFGYDNVWLGVTIEDKTVRWRADILSAIPAKVRWISWEPILDYVDFKPWSKYIKWIVGGCESGSDKRDYKDEWIEKVIEDCEHTKTPFFLKQIVEDGSVVKDPYFMGQTWLEFPEV